MSSLITLKGQLVKDVKYSLAEGNVLANLNRELVLFPLAVNSLVDNREHKSLYYVYFDKSCSALKNLKAGVTIEVEGVPFMKNLKDKCLSLWRGLALSSLFKGNENAEIGVPLHALELNLIYMLLRPRRLRQSKAIRDLVQENNLSVNDFIYPIFIKDEKNAYEEIAAMPGIFRFGIEKLLSEVEELLSLGIKAIALFPITPNELKNYQAIESYNSNNLTCKAIREIKKRFPEMLIMSDVALDPYTDHGHDGLLAKGKVLNDETVEVLAKMALVQAAAGADILGPSDMMDGRVKTIRTALEAEGFKDTMLMSYTAKYASSLYAPFRDAMGTANYHIDEKIPKDKKTYQMNPANSLEALKELELDLEEGADMVMIKPAGWYLDIIHQTKKNSKVPVVAYQVSGEYSMILAAVSAGLTVREKAIYESLISIKRAGADIILSYFAKELFSM